jgi:hypothetical protein
MDLFFSILVWIGLLGFAYIFCTHLGEYSTTEDRLFPEGPFFVVLEKLAVFWSLVGLVWLAGSIIWMIVLAYTSGVLAEVFGF